MKSLVLEKKEEINLRDFPAIDRVEETLGPRDVRIKLHTVGICGSDVHYYTHGRIGPFVVNEPMILGHEASGIVIEVGAEVQSLKTGDRVCMEPGIPDPNSRATQLGMYNIDPAVRFWATPPVHGILRPTCVHPEAFTFKLPDNVSFAEAAMVEPLAVGVHAVTKARVKPGDNAIVMGAGPIGLVTALSALAAGCARVYVTDLAEKKLEIAGALSPAIVPVNVTSENIVDVVKRDTDGWGVDLVFEATGSPHAAKTVFEPLCPGGCVVMIGGQPDPIQYDAGAAMVREARVENIFRYAHVFPRCVGMLSSGAIDVKPLITRTFEFSDSVKAFEIAASAPPADVKMQIVLPQ
ncbi:MAG: NAD(P)-dependent alcohol dehydrogenase [Alphaproteobacteria bacterium]|uniref:D-xylulose reductase n=1 Tax=Celeribacter baekdonensis TaxID=875171 RepID=A0A1G7QSX5_9RHOB|nr:NAD(P)-dependent alcohol dehydrogenase [Celeribacter baekdonensis]MBU0645022.1 NAD(P)-dependent alcohol dehydrogenase [Alphaproteobacteria bacterium]MBU1280766.1 NAD(P)-dependent alcohol dehydrogenase [Alphaproteobacteria bacterium]MBU1575190.1 NAD(P)-dependent alcohol dehydrogenase [Alphaproteobacteria bacterium]MBU1829286.1 NAD(P)-dependent alcohol dehydrogenase [Alphaproteobacteria bacterium]MBU2076752.1 NAD(P)-dependent alcohol dehydrogenase [Alphaproteobacteria bacterium]